MTIAKITSALLMATFYSIVAMHCNEENINTAQVATKKAIGKNFPLICYIAADNDLAQFVHENSPQQEEARPEQNIVEKICATALQTTISDDSVRPIPRQTNNTSPEKIIHFITEEKCREQCIQLPRITDLEELKSLEAWLMHKFPTRETDLGDAIIFEELLWNRHCSLPE